MQDETLKELWRQQPIEAQATTNEEQLASVREKIATLDRAIFWRNCRENIAALSVIAVFGYFFLIEPTLLARVGCVIVVLSGALMAAYPIWKKRTVGATPPDAAVKESLEVEWRKVNVEIHLLRSVLWWYLLPGTIGLLIFFFGIETSPLARAAFVLFILAIDGFIHYLNQRAATEKLVPRKREIEALLGVE